jgi:redox-regulated HSP33 family molecular chaperone
MKVWTVIGLVDEQNGDLYVAAVLAGRHEAQDTELTTRMEGYGELSRFVTYVDADSAEQAEAIAVDVTSQFADDQAQLWSPEELPGRRAYRRVEDVKTDKL